jgi:hypothetical protein
MTPQWFRQRPPSRAGLPAIGINRTTSVSSHAIETPSDRSGEFGGTNDVHLSRSFDRSVDLSLSNEFIVTKMSGETGLLDTKSAALSNALMITQIVNPSFELRRISEVHSSSEFIVTEMNGENGLLDTKSAVLSNELMMTNIVNPSLKLRRTSHIDESNTFTVTQTLDQSYKFGTNSVRKSNIVSATNHIPQSRVIGDPFQSLPEVPRNSAAQPNGVHDIQSAQLSIEWAVGIVFGAIFLLGGVILRAVLAIKCKRSQKADSLDEHEAQCDDETDFHWSSEVHNEEREDNDKISNE